MGWRHFGEIFEVVAGPGREVSIPFWRMVKVCVIQVRDARDAVLAAHCGPIPSPVSARFRTGETHRSRNTIRESAYRRELTESRVRHG